MVDIDNISTTVLSTKLSMADNSQVENAAPEQLQQPTETKKQSSKRASHKKSKPEKTTSNFDGNPDTIPMPIPMAARDRIEELRFAHMIGYDFEVLRSRCKWMCGDDAVVYPYEDGCYALALKSLPTYPMDTFPVLGGCTYADSVLFAQLVCLFVAEAHEHQQDYAFNDLVRKELLQHAKAEAEKNAKADAVKDAKVESSDSASADNSDVTKSEQSAVEADVSTDSTLAVNAESTVPTLEKAPVEEVDQTPTYFFFWPRPPKRDVVPHSYRLYVQRYSLIRSIQALPTSNEGLAALDVIQRLTNVYPNFHILTTVEHALYVIWPLREGERAPLRKKDGKPQTHWILCLTTNNDPLFPGWTHIPRMLHAEIVGLANYYGRPKKPIKTAIPEHESIEGGASDTVQAVAAAAAAASEDVKPKRFVTPEELLRYCVAKHFFSRWALFNMQRMSEIRNCMFKPAKLKIPVQLPDPEIEAIIDQRGEANFSGLRSYRMSQEQLLGMVSQVSESVHNRELKRAELQRLVAKRRAEAANAKLEASKDASEPKAAQCSEDTTTECTSTEDQTLQSEQK